MKRILIIVTILCSIVLLIPTLVVLLVSPSSNQVTVAAVNDEENQNVQNYQVDQDLTVTVYRIQTEEVEDVPLEQYVAGVVASEMPANFELEALKAQALTARTYVVQQMLNPVEIDLPEIPKDAIVTDSVMHQVYQEESELREKWSDFDWRWEKIQEAVAATEGEVLTYNDEPIDPSFFSTSNGYTENSEDYWSNEIPYLRSVESPWDLDSPRFTGEKVVQVDEFESKLEVTLPQSEEVGTILSRTDGGRVAQVEINGETVSNGGVELTGRYIREKLDLDSSDFEWSRNGNEIVIATRGWGHGVGMSQYGANGMAKEGHTYDEIVNYYYQDIDIQLTDQYASKLTAKK